MPVAINPLKERTMKFWALITK